MDRHLITVNSGSSTIKFSIFIINELKLVYKILIDDLNNIPKMQIKNAHGEVLFEKTLSKCGHNYAISELIKWLKCKSDEIKLCAVGHRIVHGGTKFSSPVRVDENIIKDLKEIVSLAPLHQPHNISAIEAFYEFSSEITQIACFDTAFHSKQSDIIKSYPLPEKYFNEGVIRYGFHGLSYEYICSTLTDCVGELADGKIIVAHLGNGASMCAIENNKSIASTMGFTALDGLMMGTRAGNIDPGIILYLLDDKKMTVDQVSSLLYKESGLKGVSGITNDIRQLLQSDNEKAQLAVDMFCLIAARNLASLIPTINGLDTIIFTAGIGENSSVVREKICQNLNWLGIELDAENNNKNNKFISHKDSKVNVCVIPTNEEFMIARHTKELLES